MGCHEKFLLEHRESSAPARSLLGFYLFLIFPLFSNSLCILFMLSVWTGSGGLGAVQKTGMFFLFLRKKEAQTQIGEGKRRERKQECEMSLVSSKEGSAAG